MKIEINIEKKHLYLFMAFSLAIVGTILALAAYDQSKASHGTLYTDTIERKSSDRITINSPVDIVASVDPLFRITVGSSSLKVSKNSEFIMFNPELVNGIAITGNDNSKGVFVRQDGKVGINTNSPAEELDVNGDIGARRFCINDGSGNYDCKDSWSSGVICQWKLSNPKDGSHNNFAWLSNSEIVSEKPTGICICTDYDDIPSALADPSWGGYLEIPYDNGEYWICDDDTREGCKENYFIYYSCG